MIVGIFLKEDSTFEIIVFFSLLLLGANSFTVVFLVPWAMLPNVLDKHKYVLNSICFFLSLTLLLKVLDAYLLKYGNKMDALFYTVFALFVKVLIAIYAGITQLVLR